MDAGPLRDVLTVLAGVATGVLSAAFGVGGAVVSTPALRGLGLSATLAIGTTLPSILPSAVSGSLRYSREQMIDWRVVAVTTPTGIAAAVGGAALSKAIPGEGHLLMIATALLLGFSAYRMARSMRPSTGPTSEGPVEAAPPEDEPGRNDRVAVLGAIGAGAGLLSGLLGIGGGVIMVPLFSEVARIPLKIAIATSLVCVGVFAIPGTITHAALDGIDWRFALLLAAGIVPGARVGAAAAIRATDRRLRGAVAGFLGVVSLLYLAGEIAALVD